MDSENDVDCCPQSIDEDPSEDVLKEVSQGATKIPSRTRVVLLRKRKAKSVFDWGWLQLRLVESSSQVESSKSTVWQRTHNTGFDSHWSRCCLEFMIQPPAPKSNPLSPVQSCCHPDLLRVSEIWSLCSMHMANKLYRIPAITGSDLLSLGSQALVPCCRGELVRSRNYHYASRGVGRIALRG
ncbi:hypothetical protein PIB30_026152 [Stylosanthes scabra]|uniref:Uncharacterized protein n=1 Tax=Stylosanthes scabra TaxID=79078 RepID=A0ABU6VBZ5_9FABA|nr:hypothetical protein [Stylosanthes scabra]